MTPILPSSTVVVAVLTILFPLQSHPQSEVDASTLQAKILVGYQAWFTTPGPGRSERWIHWTHQHDVPTGDPGNLAVEMYPDLREFESDELIPTRMTLGREPAPLYTASHPKTVQRHARWMREYGIDGAFVQRFLRSHAGSDQDYAKQLDRALWNFREACAAEGRVFAVMYDVSGMRETEDWRTLLKNDWTALVDTGLTKGGRYLHHQGRPVVGLWGFGFRDRVPEKPAQALEMINWFKEAAPEPYRACVLGGVPGQWRTLDGDSRQAPGWSKVYRAFDVVSPWTVGRFTSRQDADQWNQKHTLPDLALLKKTGQAYAAVVWPGFSWKNLNGGSANQIPREGGRFFWRQIYNAKKAGVSTLYVAMFDEVDEATAIYKVAENRTQVPDQGFWLTLDADGQTLPSDWYLRLAREAGRMLRRETALEAEPDFLRPPKKVSEAPATTPPDKARQQDP